MSTVRTFVRATAVVAGSSAALLMGGLMGTAHADPAPVPAPNISQQLVGTAANAPQMLQNVAGALGGQPATPPPLASASIKMPQQAAAPTAGATSLLPGLASPTPADERHSRPRHSGADHSDSGRDVDTWASAFRV